MPDSSEDRALTAARLKALDIVEDGYSQITVEHNAQDYIKARIRMALMEFYHQGAVDALDSVIATKLRAR